MTKTLARNRPVPSVSFRYSLTRSWSAFPRERAPGVYQLNNGFDPVGDHLVGMRPGNVVAKAFRAGFGLAVLLCDPTRQSPGSFNTAHTESPAALNGVSTHLRTMS